MRLVTNALWFFVGILLVLLFAINAYPHGGGLDAYGCHHDRKVGDYHCHRGEFAGQSFASQQEMLQKRPKGTDEASPSRQSVTGERAVGTTPTGRTVYEGPRGGRYHYSASGKKVYERRRR